jgi:hypothetical protein
MDEFVCKDCGAANPADARFCGGCDTYLGWDTALVTPSTRAGDRTGASDGAADTAANPAQPPRADLPQPDVVLEPGPGATLQIQVKNPSTIVDAYSVEAPWAPGWLRITHPEIRLMPNESESVTATLSIVSGTFVEARTYPARLRISSRRDTEKFVEVPVKLTVPRYGPPVTIRARPSVVPLVDTTTGRVEVILDNTASNYPRRIVLAASDNEGLVQCRFSPQTAVVPPGARASIAADFTVPSVGSGENRVRQLTISATEDDNTADAMVTLNQERTSADPLRLRLEPSVLRVRDGSEGELKLVVDNRGRTPDRTVRLQGNDPEGVVQFSFDNDAVRAARGQMTATRLRVTAPPPPPGQEVSRPFSIVGAYDADETQASGTFVQSTSDRPIKKAVLHLTPETLKRRGGLPGRYRFVIENKDESQWLHTAVSGSDPERAVQFTFSPRQFDIPPRGLAWGWVRVSAPRPERGKEVSHAIEVTATDGLESLKASGTLVQSRGDWIPYVRFLLTLLGGLLVIVGAFEPWTIGQHDYFIGDLPRIAAATDVVEKTQPSVRLAMIVLAFAMMIGVVGKGGRQTVSSAVLVGTGVVAYLVFLLSKVTIYGPMYGWYVVVAGACAGFIGGFLARL